MTTRKFGSVKMPVIVVNAGAPSGFRRPLVINWSFAEPGIWLAAVFPGNVPSGFADDIGTLERRRAAAVRDDVPIHIIAQVPVKTQRRVIFFEQSR